MTHLHPALTWSPICRQCWTACVWIRWPLQGTSVACSDVLGFWTKTDVSIVLCGLLQPPKTHQFPSHVFGNVSSPVVAHIVVKKHAPKLKDLKYPSAFRSVHGSMLVNDVADSVETQEEAGEAIRQLVHLRVEAGTELCNWASSSDGELQPPFWARGNSGRSWRLHCCLPRTKKGELPSPTTQAGGVSWGAMERPLVATLY